MFAFDLLSCLVSTFFCEHMLKTLNQHEWDNLRNVCTNWSCMYVWRMIYTICCNCRKYLIFFLTFSLFWQSDIDHSQNPKNHTTLKSHGGGSCQVVLSNKTANHKQGLRRSLSQKDLKYQDGYSVSLIISWG